MHNQASADKGRKLEQSPIRSINAKIHTPLIAILVTQ